MPSPEILLLAGPPWSGKSTIAKRFVELGQPEDARHLSLGDLKRSITSGETPSAYAEMLKIKEHHHRKLGTAPSRALIGIIEEFIQLRPSSLTILDGFPRYRDRIIPFQESMRQIGADVLALCVVDVDSAILRERSTERPARSEQELGGTAFVEQRLADHRAHVVPTLELLATDYPTYTLDGTLSLDANASRLLAIYEKYTGRGTPE